MRPPEAPTLDDAMASMLRCGKGTDGVPAVASTSTAAAASQLGAAASALASLVLLVGDRNVLTAAVKFYSVLLTSCKKTLVAQERELEELQVRHEQELNTLLSVRHRSSSGGGGAVGRSSVGVGDDKSDDDERVMITHEVTEVIFGRHEAQHDALLQRHRRARAESEAEARANFHAFLLSAAGDVARSMAVDSLAGVPLAHPVSIDFGITRAAAAAAAAEGDHVAPRVATGVPLVALRFANPLKAVIKGARAKDPSLSPIVLDASPLPSLLRCLALAPGGGTTDSLARGGAIGGGSADVKKDGDVQDDEDDVLRAEVQCSMLKIEEHMKRIAANKLGCLVLVGTEAEADELLERAATAGSVGLLAPDTAWAGVAPGVRLRCSTRLWGAHVIALLCSDVLSTGVDAERHRQALNIALNVAITGSCTLVSVVPLPSTAAKPAACQALVQGLVCAVADVQMDFNGVRIPSAAPTAPLSLLGIAAVSSANASSGGLTNLANIPYNLNVSLRVFLPVGLLHEEEVVTLGLGCEILLTRP